MGKALEVTEFEADVAEYKSMETKVTQDFLGGVMKLGEILKRQRAKYKPQKQWTEYLEKVGRTMTAANQNIRIYEYAEDNLKTLMESNLTGWEKLNTFLSLPEPLREKLAEEIKGQELTAEEFREKVVDLKGDEADVVVTDEMVDNFPIEEGFADMIEQSTLADLHFMAKKLVEEFNKIGKSFSTECVVIAEGFLGMEKAIRDLDKTNFKKLNASEKKYWKKVIENQLDRLLNAVK